MPKFFTLTFKPVGKFRELSNSEAEKMGLRQDKDMLTLCDPKRGAALSLAHKKSGFLSAIADEKAVRLRLKRDYQKMYPEITDPEDFEIAAAGKTRCAFRFRYKTAQGDFYSEVVSLVEKKHIYTITSSSSYRDKDTTHKALVNLLKSLEITAE